MLSSVLTTRYKVKTRVDNYAVYVMLQQ